MDLNESIEYHGPLLTSRFALFNLRTHLYTFNLNERAEQDGRRALLGTDSSLCDAYAEYCRREGDRLRRWCVMLADLLRTNRSEELDQLIRSAPADIVRMMENDQ